MTYNYYDYHRDDSYKSATRETILLWMRHKNEAPLFFVVKLLKFN